MEIGESKITWYGRDLSTRDVIHSITSNFVNLGVPVRIICDNGPQFSSNDFVQFTNNWGVRLTPSTLHYPQSNGHAEESKIESKIGRKSCDCKE